MKLQWSWEWGPYEYQQSSSLDILGEPSHFFTLLFLLHGFLSKPSLNIPQSVWHFFLALMALVVVHYNQDGERFKHKGQTQVFRDTGELHHHLPRRVEGVDEWLRLKIPF